MSVVDVAAVIKDGMDDPEFSREIRYFDGKLLVAWEDSVTVARFEDGQLVSIDEGTGDGDCEIVVRGRAEHWENMLERYPKPFYQCLQTTAVRHGLELSATNQTFAYLPALNRLLVLMRDARNAG